MIAAAGLAAWAALAAAVAVVIGRGIRYADQALAKDLATEFDVELDELLKAAA